MSEIKNNAVKTVSFIMIITLAGKILGLYRDILLANHYGSGMEANAFFTASLIPRTFFDAIFASAITSSFIPVFNEYIEKKGRKEAFEFSNYFLTMIIVFTFLITIIGMVFSVPLTNFFADGFNAETTALCGRLLKLMFPTVLFTGIAYSFVGVLQSLDEFNLPAAMSIASNSVIIFYFLFLDKRFGIFGLAAAFLAGWLMQALMQIPCLLKKGWRFRFAFSLKHEGMKKVFLIMVPVMVSTWVQPINIAISTKFGSRLFEGAGVSAINYANNLYIIIVGVFVLSVANVVFPKLSKLTANNEDEEFSKVTGQTIQTLLFLVIPMTVGLMALSTPIVSLLYEGDNFTAFSTEITSRALFYLSLGMVGFALQTVLSRAFFAIQDGKTPLYAGVSSIVANGILCVLLIDKMDVGGLALASSVSSIINGIVLFYCLKRKKGDFMPKGFGVGLLKMMSSAAVMAIVVAYLYVFVSINLPTGFVAKMLGLGLSAGAGVIIYMLGTWFLGVEEARLVFGLAGRLLKRGKN